MTMAAATPAKGRIRTMAERKGLYPGTFDPLTHGHVDIIRRAVRFIDHLIVGVARNSEKGPLFSLDERVAMVEAETTPIAKDSGARITVQPFDGLLIKFAETAGVNVIVRGLRAVSDFEYEFQMAGMNDRLNPDIETVFLMADARYQSIASRLVKEIARLGGDVAPFAPSHVAEQLARKVKEMKS